MDAPLQQLLALLARLDLEHDDWLALESVAWAGNDLTLHLAVHEAEHPAQRWRVRCRSVRRSRISNDDGVAWLRIETEHPLLLPHTEPTAELYFSSRPHDPDATIGRLVEAHRAIVGGWFDCLQFFNLGPHGSLRRMLDGGFGMIAKGPAPVIDRYGQVLRRAGVAVSSPPPRPVGWWDGERFVEETKPMYAVLLGPSYVISPSVAAETE